jgi:serine/threonine protein kinase
MAQALAMFELHNQRIVRCDLKPSNILVMWDGHIAITDFGISLTPTRSRATAKKTSLLNNASSSPKAGRDVRVPNPRAAHQARQGVLYLRSGHVVARRRHLRDVHRKGESRWQRIQVKRWLRELFLEPLLTQGQWGA